MSYTILPYYFLSEKKKERSQNIHTHNFFTVLFVRTIGNFIFLFSIFLLLRTFYLPLGLEIKFALEQYFNKQYIVGEIATIQESSSEDSQSLSQVLANLKKTEVLIPKDPNFSVIIPKIGANANVIPNVNVIDEKDYMEKLRLGVAHADGTKFPGENGNIFLFAHSTDYAWNVSTYNAIFYLLYKLEEGDEVDLFYKGKRYKYTVNGKKIINPTEVEYLTRETNEELLTLQTCWPPGTSLQRLLIFATPYKQNN